MYDSFDTSEGRYAVSVAHVPNAVLVVTQIRIEDHALCKAGVRVLVVGQGEKLKIVFASDLVYPIGNKAEGNPFRFPIFDVANELVIAGAPYDDELLLLVKGRSIQRVL